MRTPLITLALLAATLPATALAAPINAVAGDLSWRERHGRAPTASDEAREIERIQTHLAWVERELRSRRVAHLDDARRARRKTLLDALAIYRAAAEFPHNTDHPGRRPRFVDPDGRTCAVGHLIDVTGRRDLTESIAARFEYAYLADMRDARLDAWIAESGFTARELAMIQPSYHFRDPEPVRPVEPPPPPAMDGPTLATVMAATNDAARACLDANGARAAVVIVTDRPDGVRRIQTRTLPRRRAAETCVRTAVRDALLRLHRSPPAQLLMVRRTYRATPRTPRERTLSAAHDALDAAASDLFACMPYATAGRRGQLVVRARVDADGRVHATSVRFPRLPRGHGLLGPGGPSDEQIRQCVVARVEAITLPDSVPARVVHALPFAGTHPGVGGVIGALRGP